MSLEEYVRKRKFDKTPEPAPGEMKPKPTQGRYFVQRHDATRLHYDLRLEIGGTLKSWAVPKGPTLVPLQKNLAMHVEDHPLDYGPFEGNIPKGNYGAGSVMLWDFGTFDLLGDEDGEAQIKRGDLKFRLAGEKLKGDFALVRMKGRGKGNEWLLIKKRDEHADPNWDIESFAYSAKTGRTQEEIAQDLPPKKAKASSQRPKKAAAKQVASKSSPSESSPSKSSKLKPAELTGARPAPMPKSITPMMATAVTKAPEGRRWIYEIKWDGIRAVCFIENGRVRMISRNGNSYDRQFPELTVMPNYVRAETAIVDGEIAVLDANGRASFSEIQPRIHQTDPNSVAHLARKTPAIFFAFDLIYLDGYDLRGAPLSERRAALEAVLETSDRIRLSQHFTTSGEQMLDAARQAGLEGILAKQWDSKYEERRSRDWLKVKIHGQQEFVICGYTHGERSTFSSLVLGLYDKGKLTWAGNVGTGFNDQTLALISKKLAPLRTPKSPFDKLPVMLRDATWVEPKLVCECKFNEWTKDGKLRAPVFLGLREDKQPEECVREPGPASDDGQPSTAKPEKAKKTTSTAVRDEEFIPKRVKEHTTRVDGHSLRFTNVDKIYYPKDGITKRDVINYYAAVAEYIVPHLEDRPLSLKRYPNGIHEEFFFQKDIPEGYPDWLRIEPIYSEHRGSAIRYVVCNDVATLLFLTNLGCIDQNPWMSRIHSLDYPDYILIDLDPQECAFEKIIQAMKLVKQVLDEIGLAGYPKTTGGDGMHIFIPIEPKYTYEQARSFAEILSQLVVSENPDLFTTPRSVAKRRKNRVYFDYLQISSAKTIAAPYVLRAYDGAPVATPLSWDEVRPGLHPNQFNLKNAIERFKETGDLFKPVLTKKQRIEPSLQRLGKLLQKQ
jgi:bifunctional non-homologous end joining protein LigD